MEQGHLQAQNSPVADPQLSSPYAMIGCIVPREPLQAREILLCRGGCHVHVFTNNFGAALRDVLVNYAHESLWRVCRGERCPCSEYLEEEM